MNSLRYIHLVLGIAALVCGLYAILPFLSKNDLITYTAITTLLLGLVNLQQFSNTTLHTTNARTLLAAIGSVLLLAGVVIALITQLLGLTASLLTTAISISIAGSCLFAVLTLSNLLRNKPRHSSTYEQDVNSDERELGTVKWFNTSKGFGFISRDQGEDVFVHFRAIRGEGHRVLTEGQRVEFVVAHREKGLQAEDVDTLD